MESVGEGESSFTVVRPHSAVSSEEAGCFPLLNWVPYSLVYRGYLGGLFLV